MGGILEKFALGRSSGRLRSASRERLFLSSEFSRLLGQVAWAGRLSRRRADLIELARLESENLELSARLETRKILDRAKGIMQRDLKISEPEAYLTLQRESRERGKSMKEIAEAILLNDEIRHTKRQA